MDAIAWTPSSVLRRCGPGLVGAHPLWQRADPTEADQQHGHREETLIAPAVVFPAHEQPPEIAERGEATLHFVGLPIIFLTRDEWTSPLGLPVLRASLRRNAHADAALAQGTAKGATIIPAIRDQLLGSLLRAASWAGNADGVQRVLGELHLSGGGAIQMEAQGKPVAVDDQHPLRPLPLLGETDLVASLLRRSERTIQEGHGPVEPAAPVERREGGTPDAFPDAGFTPAFEPTPDGGRCAVLAWQVLPTTSRDEHVDNALDRPADVSTWSPYTRRSGQ